MEGVTDAAEPITDEELTALALAADPETAVDAGAVPIHEAMGGGPLDLLPDWYMPSPMAVRGRLLHGWRRRVGWLIIASFILINAYGLCSTYGHVGFG